MSQFFPYTISLLAPLILIGALQGLQPAAAQPRAIAFDEKSKVAIVLPQNATLPEQTAARDLDDYLTRSTQGEFTIEIEKAGIPSPAIYVGATGFAKRAGIDAAALASEAWRIKTQNGNLILVGGGTRGTLYATYRFLEDYAGVRWWNPWEETVPVHKTLSLSMLDRRGKPVFRYRDIYMLYGNDGGRFGIRNRLNRDGDAPISAEYGGGRNYGPPYHVHTTYKILSPTVYFKDHPDWFILPGGGTPDVTNSQLAMSNPAMRQEFLKLLREIIRKSQQEARENNLPVPDVFSVSQEDNFVGFATPTDAELLKQNNGAESAIVLDFVNYLADGIKDEFPGTYIDTLAYFSSEPAPTKIRPRDNVIIRLTDTQSNMLLPITDDRNKVLRDNVVSWSKITKNLRIWDYAVTYTYIGLPTPTANTFAPDLRFLASHGVEGVFVEHEYPILADMRDFKVWLECKLYEDPHQNYDGLVREFTDGFYGPAGRHVRDYLTELQSQARKPLASGKITDLTWFAPLYQHDYLTLDFLQRASAIFDRAEASVAKDIILSRRVRHARLSLDRAILALYPSLMTQWVSEGQLPEAMPLDRTKIGARALQAWQEQADLRLSEAQRTAERDNAQVVIKGLTFGPAYMPVPVRFRDLPAEQVIAYNPSVTRNHENKPKNVNDPGAEMGVTNRFEITDDQIERYRTALPWGIYDTVDKKMLLSGSVNPAEAPGPGYHWYKLGTTSLSKYSFIYIHWGWNVQIDLDNAFDMNKPNQQFDVWASLKFEGPAFPHGKAEEKNAISLERVVLVKKAN